MSLLVPGLLVGVGLLLLLRADESKAATPTPKPVDPTNPKPVDPTKPPYTQPSKVWFLIQPKLMMAYADIQVTDVLKKGSAVVYWLGDGANAAPGDDVSPDNSKVVVEVAATIDGAPTGKAANGGDEYPATVIAADFFKGTLADAPTQAPAPGQKVTINRTVVLSSPFGQ